MNGPIAGSVGIVLALSLCAAVADDRAGAESRPAKLTPREVQFKTADGVQITADYYPPRTDESAKAPAAILIHMYPADRGSWAPIAPKLHEAGFAVLAYDIRGKGGSTAGPKKMDLANRYRERDPKLFADAWRDAEAAVKWLGQQKEVDAANLVLLGASIGCSISIDYAGRNKDIRAVVCLSPGTDYFKVDSLTQIKRLGERPVLLIAPQEEEKAPHALAAAARNATVDIRPGTREYHGTGMFGAAYGQELMNRIVKFVKDPPKRADKAPKNK